MATASSRLMALFRLCCRGSSSLSLARRAASDSFDKVHLRSWAYIAHHRSAFSDRQPCDFDEKAFIIMLPAILLSPAVIRRLRHHDETADLDEGLDLGDQLLGSCELADDQHRCVPGPFHGEIPGPVWPAEDTHSPWTGFPDPGQPNPASATRAANACHHLAARFSRRRI